MTETQIATRQSQALTTIDSAALDDLDALYDERQSAATRKTYAAAWRSFVAWCQDQDREPLPADPETVALYFRNLALTRTMTTVRTYGAAIADRHTQAGLDNPCQHHAVKGTLRGMKRRKAKETPKQAKGATADDVATVLDALDDNPVNLRAKAMLSVARSALARRSELVAIDFSDLDQGDGIIAIYRQKTDTWTDAAMTSGAMEHLTAWTNWLASNQISDGPLFRSIDRHGRIGGKLNPASVSLIFRAAYEQAGLSAKGISGHSARVGTVQDLTTAGADVAAIAVAGGWTGTSMPVRYGSKAAAKRGPVATMLDV